MSGRAAWLSAMVWTVIGGCLGYAVGLFGWPALGAWLATTAVTYALVFTMVVGRGLLWVRTTARDTSGVAAISLDLVQEFIRVDAVLTLAGLAYFLALVVRPGETLSLAASGAVCGAATVIVRTLPLGRRWSSDGEQSERVRQA